MQEIQSGHYWLPLQKMVNVYLLQTAGGLTLVDTGYGRQAGQIIQAVRSLEREHGSLKHILITHGHNDHIGGAAAIQAETGAEIWMHPAEAGALRGGAGNSFVAPAGANLLMRLAPGRVDPAPVDHELVDGKVLPFAPDWQVRFTPGHTPGQCCFYSAERGTLILGDAMMHWFGRLSRPFKMVTVDMEQNMAGMRRLCELAFDVALFGHGPPILRDARARLKALI